MHLLENVSHDSMQSSLSLHYLSIHFHGVLKFERLIRSLEVDGLAGREMLLIELMEMMAAERMQPMKAWFLQHSRMFY